MKKEDSNILILLFLLPKIRLFIVISQNNMESDYRINTIFMPQFLLFRQQEKRPNLQ